MVVVLMGVSGAGKSTIGEALAQRLGWRFLDADDYHSPQSVAKMAAGIPLEDEDRAPWLARLNALLREEARLVLACSALKERYRARLAEGVATLVWVYLKAEPQLIRDRAAQRHHRYMPASLVDSQFAALEPPAQAIVIDVACEVTACVEAIAARLPPEARSY